ncbi:MAG: aldehyde dehydrogenase EutE [Phycisphaerales bacterium]|nr:aldehyde dehydrogenase EutE [Phycisphaerales bacterium]
MTQLSDQQIDAIAMQVLGRLSGGAIGPRPAPAQDDFGREVLGVFAELDSAVSAAEKAFLALDKLPLATRDAIIANIRRRMMENAELLASEAHRETGLGRYEDKVIKNKLVTNKTPGSEVLRAEAQSGDRGLSLFERAAFGVIASITPTTNPTSTIICNTIGMVAAGNTVVFNVHPNARGCSIKCIDLLNRAIIEAGGPPNVVTTLSHPTVETAQALMVHPGVRLLVVTGGAGVVKVAMKSGKRAICAGPGNPPIVVDETADIDQAGRDVVLGASFDNNIICTDEKETFVVSSVADKLLASMRANGAVVLTQSQTKQLENLIFTEMHGPRKAAAINRDLIGKNAGVILQKIGMNVPEDLRLGVIDVGVNHPLVWTEQMMPIMPVARVSNCDEAIDLAVEAEGGRRHTAVMHSRNISKLSRMARLINCSIFVKNGPCYAGLGEGGEGYTSFSIASPTGEGMTDPRTFSRLRRCVLVDHFRIV